MSDPLQHPHHGQPLKTAGAPLAEAASAIIMLHGRGATAADILSLARELPGDRVCFLAPQAYDYTWYPYSFLTSLERNEPYLSSALMVVSDLLKRIAAASIPAEHTVLLGFSQGACLALEYAARHAQRYGGIVGLSGGLIGPDGTPRGYPGSFSGTPVFLGCDEHDSHIPAARVLETEQVMRGMGADVTRKLYPRLGHSLNRDEIAAAQSIISSLNAVVG